MLILDYLILHQLIFIDLIKNRSFLMDFYFYIIRFINIHKIIPIISGIINDKKVIKLLFVSFFIVNNVVEHGKWNKLNIKKETLVVIDQPLSNKIFFSELIES